MPLFADEFGIFSLTFYRSFFQIPTQIWNRANTWGFDRAHWPAGLLAVHPPHTGNATNVNQRKPVSCVIAPSRRRLVGQPITWLEKAESSRSNLYIKIVCFQRGLFNEASWF